MSKYWILLNDIRVNCAAQTDGASMDVCLALVRMYTPYIWEQDDDLEEYYYG